MPEVSLTFLIVAAAAALLVGFGAAFLIQNSKLAPMKAELDLAKREREAAVNAEKAASQKCDALADSLVKAREEIAEKNSDIKNLAAQAYSLKEENAALNNDKDNLNRLLTVARAEKAAAEENNRHLEKWIEQSKDEMKNSFASLSKDIAENNSKVFLESANDKLGDFAKTLGENLKGNNEAVSGIVKPVGDDLKVLHEKVAGLSEKVEGLGKQSGELKNATDMLSSTLKNNAQRGRWGEEQLRKVAELSGMVEHIDFDEQSVNNDGARPDMVVHLTGGRNIPVDSKAPMNSYLLYLDDTDEQARQKHLAEHVKALKNHIDALYKKAYWKSEDRSAEMVAMVVPYESGLSAAFTADREIFSYAMEKNVLLLSPMTFYAFLKSVSVGWQENAMSKNAKEIALLSKELIDRFDKFFSYMDGIGVSLDKARAQYDGAMSSYNRRLAVTFNRFKALSSGMEGGEAPLLPEESE